MADLSSASFTAVNDVETAQGAPVSEALAQKYGSNENNLNARITSNDSDIATNASDISTLQSDLSALESATKNIDVSKTSLAVSGSFQTIASFVAVPTAVIVHAVASGGYGSGIWVSGQNAFIDTTSADLEFRISGSNFQVRANSGSGTHSFNIVAIINN